MVSGEHNNAAANSLAAQVQRHPTSCTCHHLAAMHTIQLESKAYTLQRSCKSAANTLLQRKQSTNTIKAGTPASRWTNKRAYNTPAAEPLAPSRCRKQNHKESCQLLWVAVSVTGKLCHVVF